MYENEVLNTYIMYGAVESLIASGLAKNVIIQPYGTGYIVIFEPSANKTKTESAEEDIILTGAKILANKILSRHNVLGKNIDIQRASLKNNLYKNLKEILELIAKYDHHDKTEINKEQLVYISLSPFSGKQKTTLYEYKGSGVTHIKKLDLALALIGFHYYVPYAYYTEDIKQVRDKKITTYHLYISIKPVTRTTYDFLSGIKELKTPIIQPINKTREKDYRVYLLSVFLRNPSIIAYTIATSMHTKIITYEITQVKNQTTSLRRLEEYDAVRLSSFVYYMKTNDMAGFNNFMYNLLRGKPDNQSSVDEKELRNALIEFFYAVIYADYDRLYQSMRKIKRLGFTIPSSTARHMSEWMINALEKTMVPL